MSGPEAEREEVEEVAGELAPPAETLPVVSSPAPVDRDAGVPLPAVQAAAVAATGLVAGAATVVAVRRVRTRGLRPRRRSRRARPAQVLASRSFLVDIHLLDRG